MIKEKIQLLILVLGLPLILLNCVKETKNIDDWTVQKRLDRGESIGQILKSHQPHDIIGKSAEGGIIIHIDRSQNRGLSFYPKAVINNIPFGCKNNKVETSRLIYNGVQNTNELLEECDSIALAAFVCDTLNINGFSDWFLPSSDELEIIIAVIKNDSLTIGDLNEKYWSSTTTTPSRAEFWSLTQNSRGSQSKDSTASIIAVREFSF